MKKSQRLRFYALITKQSKGEALTAAESAELATLAGLVATHPSASEDTDDTTTTTPAETDEEKKEREAKEKKAKEEEEKAKAAGGRPGVTARLAAAMAGLAGGTPAQAAASLQVEQSAHAATRASLTQAQADLTAAKASLKSTETALAEVCDFFGIKPGEVAGKSAKEIDALLTAKIGAAATAQIAGMGLNPGTLPAPAGAAAQPTTKAELLAAYHAITDASARAAFYAKHEKAMLG